MKPFIGTLSEMTFRTSGSGPHMEFHIKAEDGRMLVVRGWMRDAGEVLLDPKAAALPVMYYDGRVYSLGEHLLEQVEVVES